jgi:hypothetical protein
MQRVATPPRAECDETSYWGSKGSPSARPGQRPCPSGASQAPTPERGEKVGECEGEGEEENSWPCMVLFLPLAGVRQAAGLPYATIYHSLPMLATALT